MKFETKMVGPEQARELLKLNINNRPTSNHNITFLSNEILRGQWKNTGDTIKISKSGKLIDGQHRLQAIIKAGISVELNFCIGVDDETFAMIDVGKKRTRADVLSTSGISDGGVLSSAVALILNIKSGNFITKTRSFSNTDVLRFVKLNPEISDMVSYIKKGNKRFHMLTDSSILGLYWLFCNVSVEESDSFLEKYWTGLNIEDDSPIKLLRDILINDSIKKSKIRPINKVIYVATAFRLYKNNRKVKRLIIDETKFPDLQK